jgi:cobalt-zinc-cadmium efflux system outer membrane protein
MPERYSVFYTPLSINMLITLVFYLILPSAFADNLGALSSHEETRGTLRLAEALKLALIKNPELTIFSTEIQIKEAMVFQVGRYPNPILDASASNLGNPAYEGFDGESLSLELSQLIELGGKRTARIQAANLTQKLALWDYETKRIDVMMQVAQAFIKVLAAQEFLLLAEKMQTIADQMSATTLTLYNLGNVAAVEKTKANIIQSNTRIEYMRAEKNLEISRSVLAATWGSSRAKFESVAGDLEAVQILPKRILLFEKIKLNPDLARWTAEINQRNALITLEKSKAVPDITVSFGINHNLVPNEAAILAGFSIPLPLFDKNQGSILAARYEANKAEERRYYQKFNVKRLLNKYYQQLKMAYDEIQILRDEMIPNAKTAYDISKKGYQYGKFDLLNVLEAQRTLFQIQMRYLTTLTDYHLNVAYLERLTGSALNEEVKHE